MTSGLNQEQWYSLLPPNVQLNRRPSSETLLEDPWANAPDHSDRIPLGGGNPGNVQHLFGPPEPLAPSRQELVRDLWEEYTAEVAYNAYINPEGDNINPLHQRISRFFRRWLDGGAENTDLPDSMWRALLYPELRTRPALQPLQVSAAANEEHLGGAWLVRRAWATPTTLSGEAARLW